jgi:hypothetical protein
MFKLISFLFLFILFSYNTFAQAVPRVVLVEEFTSSTCAPCAQLNPAFNATLESFNANTIGGSIASVKYQMHWPGAGDPSYNADGEFRKNYYNISGVPHAEVDGGYDNSPFGVTSAVLNTALAVPAYMTIDVSSVVNANNIIVTTTVTPTQNFTSSQLKLHVVITEDLYHFYGGTTNETEYTHVMRKMFPDGNGLLIGSLSAGVPITVIDSFAFSISNPVSQLSYDLWEGMSNVTIVAFVQDDATKLVEQAGFTTLNCSKNSVTFNVNEPSSCNFNDANTTVHVSGGITPYSFIWNDPLNQADSSANNLAPGYYVVTISDANGCIRQDSIIINDIGGPTLSLSSTPTTCYGVADATASVTPTGNSPFTFLWNTGGTNQIESGLPSGFAYVTVTDVNNCNYTDQIQIDEAQQIIMSFYDTMPNCYGYTTGAISLNVIGGTSPYFYSWSNGSTNQHLSQVGSGSYSVTVTDANNCIVTDSSSIAYPPQLFTSTDSIDASSFTACDGQAIVTPSGIIPPNFTYLWDDPNNQTDSIATGLCIGLYHVTVTTYRGCSVEDSIEVLSFNSIESYLNNNVVVYPNPANNFITIESLNPEGEIVDIKGKTVMTFTDKEVNITSLSEGIYFLRLGTIYTKIIKQ